MNVARSLGRPRADAVDGRLDRRAIQRVHGRVVAIQRARIVGNQGRVEQDLDQDVAQEVGPKPVVWLGSRLAQPAQLQRQLGKGSRAVKPIIVAAMLHDARGHAANRESSAATNGCRLLAAHPYPPIDHIQPVRHRRAGQEVGIVDEVPSVGEVVHGEYIWRNPPVTR